jgi:hypothetical protein
MNEAIFVGLIIMVGVCVLLIYGCTEVCDDLVTHDPQTEEPDIESPIHHEI